MKAHKVLIFHPILWSHYKGKVFSEFYKLTKDTNIHMQVVHIAMNETGRKYLGEVDLEVHNYPYKVLFNKSLEETTNIQRIFYVLKTFIEYKPDIVAIPGWNEYYSWVVALVSKIMGKKVILQNDSTEQDRPRLRYKEFIKSVIVKLSDAYWCYGEASVNYLKRLGAPETGIFVSVQSTDNDAIWSVFQKSLKSREFKIQRYGWKRRNFIFVGRLSPEKNVPLLLKAFASVKGKSSLSGEWGLIIVGDGPQRQNIEALIKELRLLDVYLVGGKSWKEVPEYYALADVFILPSISETWGLVVNEAMVCGLPVVVSRRAGAYYDLVKEGYNGFGFDPYNQEELEDIMLKFIEGKVDMKLMGEKSREIISNYTPERAAMQMLESIKAILNIK